MKGIPKAFLCTGLLAASLSACAVLTPSQVGRFKKFGAAETVVTAALQQPGLTPAQRDLLDELAENLRDLDNQHDC